MGFQKFPVILLLAVLQVNLYACVPHSRDTKWDERRLEALLRNLMEIKRDKQDFQQARRELDDETRQSMFEREVPVPFNPFANPATSDDDERSVRKEIGQLVRMINLNVRGAKHSYQKKTAPYPYEPDENIPKPGEKSGTKRTGRLNRRNLFEFSSDDILINHNLPFSFGVNLDEIYGRLHDAGKLREGQASDDHMCDIVTTVPDQYRDSSYMFQPISDFYQKYTHAYNIPIVASNGVGDDGLKRVCYTLRYMFGGRYDIRNSYYKFYGYVGILAANELTTDMPEYSTWDASYWDSRARGLGATFAIPMTSSGDENQRCLTQDNYWDQDIFVHELGHGVHNLGGNFVIPGFGRFLNAAYSQATSNGQWANTYAGSNHNEYYATGQQFFHNAVTGFRVIPTDGTLIENDADLKAYDPALYDLLALAQPCGADDFIERCDFNPNDKRMKRSAGVCTLNNFELVSPSSDRSRAFNCGKKLAALNGISREECADFACEKGGNAFHYLTTTRKCFPLNCPDLSNMGIQFVDIAYEVYTWAEQTAEEEQTTTTTSTTTPTTTTRQEQEHIGSDAGTAEPEIRMHCTRRGDLNPNCAVDSDSLTICGPPTVDSVLCENLGCCWNGNDCHYPVQECKDVRLFCGDLAKQGWCEANWPWMIRMCPFACDECDEAKSLTAAQITTLEGLCQDVDQFCSLYEYAGYCTDDTYASLVQSICPISCGLCPPIGAEDVTYT